MRYVNIYHKRKLNHFPTLTLKRNNLKYNNSSVWPIPILSLECHVLEFLVVFLHFSFFFVASSSFSTSNPRVPSSATHYVYLLCLTHSLRVECHVQQRLTSMPSFFFPSFGLSPQHRYYHHHPAASCPKTRPRRACMLSWRGSFVPHPHPLMTRPRSPFEHVGFNYRQWVIQDNPPIISQSLTATSSATGHVIDGVPENRL